MSLSVSAADTKKSGVVTIQNAVKWRFSGKKKKGTAFGTGKNGSKGCALGVSS
jgi:hypothetical protein